MGPPRPLLADHAHDVPRAEHANRASIALDDHAMDVALDHLCRRAADRLVRSDGHHLAGHLRSDRALRKRQQGGARLGPGLGATNLQQIGRRDHAREASIVLYDGEAGDVQTTQEVVGLVQHLPHANAVNRSAHVLLDRHIEGRHPRFPFRGSPPPLPLPPQFAWRPGARSSAGSEAPEAGRPVKACYPSPIRGEHDGGERIALGAPRRPRCEALLGGRDCLLSPLGAPAPAADGGRASRRSRCTSCAARSRECVPRPAR
jgi:hypothetical protein